VQRRLLQSKQQDAGPSRLDAIGGESIHYFEEGDLHIRHRFERREVKFAGFGTAANLDALVTTVEVTLMEMAKLFATKNW